MTAILSKAELRQILKALRLARRNGEISAEYCRDGESHSVCYWIDESYPESSHDDVLLAQCFFSNLFEPLQREDGYYWWPRHEYLPRLIALDLAILIAEEMLR